MGADFIFEARLESYQNPTHTRFNGSCCDGPQDGVGVCTDPCDNFFIFCVQEFTSTDRSVSQENCPLLHHVSQSILQDNVTFSMNQDLGRGVSNPLSFTGSGTWQVSQEYILCAGHCGDSTSALHNSSPHSQLTWTGNEARVLTHALHQLLNTSLKCSVGCPISCGTDRC